MTLERVSFSASKVVTASKLARDYNKGLEEAKAAVALHNERMTQDLVAAGACRDTLHRCLLPEPQECPPLDGRWCRRFLEMMRWKQSPVNTGGAYLEWDDPRLTASRKQLHQHLASGVHGFMVLNVDQVWRQSLRTGKKTLMKVKNRFLIRDACPFLLFVGLSVLCHQGADLCRGCSGDILYEKRSKRIHILNGILHTSFIY